VNNRQQCFRQKEHRAPPPCCSGAHICIELRIFFLVEYIITESRAGHL
jgi:hypothetical protein